MLIDEGPKRKPNMARGGRGARGGGRGGPRGQKKLLCQLETRDYMNILQGVAEGVAVEDLGADPLGVKLMLSMESI